MHHSIKSSITLSYSLPSRHLIHFHHMKCFPVCLPFLLVVSASAIHSNALVEVSQYKYITESTIKVAFVIHFVSNINLIMPQSCWHLYLCWIKHCLSLSQPQWLKWCHDKRPVGLSSFVNCPPVVASFLTQRQLSINAGWQHMGRVPHPNYVDPECYVATVCHHVRFMYWEHLGHFQRAISHLKWHKIVCMRYLACAFSQMKSTDMFSMYLQSGVPRHFIWWFIAGWT